MAQSLGVGGKWGGSKRQQEGSWWGWTCSVSMSISWFWHCAPVLQGITAVGNGTGDGGSLYYFLAAGESPIISKYKVKREREVIQLGEVEASGLGRGLSCTIFSDLLKAHYTSELPQEPDVKGCPQGDMEIPNKRRQWGTSLMVQKLRLHTSKVGDPGSNPGQVTRSHMPQLSSHAAIKDPTCHNWDSA